MKIRDRFLSMIVVLTMVVTMFTGTAAFAAESDSVISVHDSYETVTQVSVGTRTHYEVQLKDSSYTVTVQSSDDTVLKPVLQPQDGSTEYYDFYLEAYKIGQATITFKASDNTTLTRDIAVVGPEAQRDYTITSDVTGDFTLAKGSSRIIKVHYESTNLDSYSYPRMIADPSGTLSVKQIYDDYDNGDYYFQVDALGAAGSVGTLYAAGSNFIPVKFCSVTVGQNSKLRLDTTGTYSLNTNESYRFIAYTSSTTAPDVTVFNDMASVELLGKVSGGYQYRLTAQTEGDTLVQVTSQGDTVTFPLSIHYNDAPTVVSDTPTSISVPKGSSYTYRLTIMGGGEPTVVADTAGVATAQIISKVGLYYYCKVTATGNVGDTTNLRVTFPESGDSDFDVALGMVTVKAPLVTMKSDTNSNFTVKYGSSYTFRISGATGFAPGSSGIFRTDFVKKVGSDTYYRITPIGKPGQQAGFYMTYPGITPQKVCVVTVGAAPTQTIQSDTNHDFKLAYKTSYQFKITAAGAAKISFNPGSSGVFNVTFIRHTGSDFYYKITAVGQPGRQSGIYMARPGQAAVRACIVTIR